MSSADRPGEGVGGHCPRCGAEYRPGFEVCADCGVPLVPGPAPPELTDVDEAGDGSPDEDYDRALSDLRAHPERFVAITTLPWREAVEAASDLWADGIEAVFVPADDELVLTGMTNEADQQGSSDGGDDEFAEPEAEAGDGDGEVEQPDDLAPEAWQWDQPQWIWGPPDTWESASEPAAEPSATDDPGETDGEDDLENDEDDGAGEVASEEDDPGLDEDDRSLPALLGWKLRHAASSDRFAPDTVLFVPADEQDRARARLGVM